MKFLAIVMLMLTVSENTVPFHKNISLLAFLSSGAEISLDDSYILWD